MIGRMGKANRPIALKEQTTTQNSCWNESHGGYDSAANSDSNV